MDMHQIVIWMATGLFAIYVGFGGMLYALQRGQQYFPDGTIAVPPHLASLGVALVAIQVEDGETIAAWFRPAENGGKTLLYFPGNGGSVADSQERFAELLQGGFGFLGVSYRGYPGSSGSPSETGLFLDGLASFDWLTDAGVSAEEIVLYGWSLGSGVASKVASERPAAALVLEAPFLSAEAIAQKMYPLYPVGLLMKDRYRTDLVLPRITQPLVVLHGTEDLTIPVDHGREIVRRYTGPKLFLEFAGGSHADLWDRDGWRKIRDALIHLKVLR